MTAGDPVTDEIPAAPVPETEAETATAPKTDPDTEQFVLFDPADAERLRTRWRAVQTGFVDDPKGAIHEADQLVTQVIQSLTASFAAHKDDVDGQWQDGDRGAAATEELRLAMRRYRTLFNQLLNA